MKAAQFLEGNPTPGRMSLKIHQGVWSVGNTGEGGSKNTE